MTSQLRGIASLVDRFDGFLIDQYGVLHDGQAPFPGAIAALDALAATGKPIVALTNSGKRAAANAARLARLGFPQDRFAAVISSGELVLQDITERRAAGHLAAGAPVAVLTRDDFPSGLLDSLNVEEVAPTPEAALLLIAGVAPETRSRSDYAALLAPLAARQVPAVSVNPDRVMYSASGPVYGPGVVAEDYARASNQAVITLGKPSPTMFAAGVQALGNIPPARILMIGDSPEHDIAGAARAGCATLLISGGIQGGTDGGSAADFTMPLFVW